MKKLFTLMAAGMFAATMTAQTVTESKTFDNVYIGINGGVATKTTGHAWMKDLNSNAGLRIGRNFTPVFGLAVESNAYFSNKPWKSVGTAVRAVNTSLLGTVNLSNWFGGYEGEPRPLEVSAIYGLGWGHVFGNSDKYVGADFKNPDQGAKMAAGQNIVKSNSLTSKAGLNFAFNLGDAKAWQFYVEPAVIWGLNGFGYEGVEYNINKSFVQLNAGFVYKFKNSNDSHNFTIAQLRDQHEIDALNSTINDLRNQLAQKPKEVVKEVVKEVPAAAPKQVVKVENLVFVTFAQGKSVLTRAAKNALDNIKSGSRVQVVGTASPEGSKEINDRLSQSRADVVANYLKNRGVVIEEATGKGVQGATSNRLAVVYVQ